MGTVLNFTLDTSTPATQSVTIEAPAGAVRGKVSDAFLGTGLLTPFRRDGNRDFTNASGLALVKSSIRTILGLRGSSPTTQGELPWRPSLGSQLHRLRHANNDSLLEDLARIFVVEALERYEPRITLTNVVVERVDTSFGPETALLIVVFFRLITSNVPNNRVLLEEHSVQVQVPLAA